MLSFSFKSMVLSFLFTSMLAYFLFISKMLSFSFTSKVAASFKSMALSFYGGLLYGAQLFVWSLVAKSKMVHMRQACLGFMT